MALWSLFLDARTPIISRAYGMGLCTVLGSLAALLFGALVARFHSGCQVWSRTVVGEPICWEPVAGREVL